NPIRECVPGVRFAHMIMAEFFNVGDRERAQGITPPPFRDRELAATPGNQVIANCQTSFIKNIVLPTLDLMAEVLCILPLICP
ncbi:hypothetical protein KIPB_016455, partial [Kipferlia bialata]